MQSAQANWLPDGRRLHLHHGPIDMIVSVDGPGRRDGQRRAVARFETLLEELVADLPRLRAPHGAKPKGETAQQMVRAVAPFAPAFITPMAAVAGAGADTILRAILDGPGIEKAHVNNGGDVAFHLSAGASVQAVVATRPVAQVKVQSDDPVRGLATSGRGGRSHSLGIADAVTVLSRDAATADAAATMIANAVDLPEHPSVRRCPAIELSPESDLGDRPVTVDVGPLTESEIATALLAGVVLAERLRARDVIHAAYLTLREDKRTVGTLGLIEQKDPEYA